MLILGIETSCDDTGIAILECSEKNCKILSNIISSQVKIHAPFGGVVPNLASRAHAENIVPCLKKALEESQCSLKKIDLIAATVGPGLIPCLLVGVNAGRALSYVLKKPIIGVNHIEGHIFANWLAPVGENLNFPPRAGNSKLFPAICLVVSGGHTQLVVMRDFGQYKIIGETRDDAAGEAFDKVARLLNLGYPGGPIIAQRAEKGDASAMILPRPMIKTKDFDFSFSGLKTAVFYEVKKNLKEISSQKYVNNLCAGFQRAVIDVLITKTIKAAKEYKAKSIMLSGGVAANDVLRQCLAQHVQKIKLKFFVPPKNFCTDNAVMIALAAYFHCDKATSWHSIEADANLRFSEKMHSHQR